MTGVTVVEPGTEQQGRQLWLTLLALSMAGMVVSVQQTVVIPLLPRLMATFGVSVSEVTWVFTASLLAAAVATPLLSRLGDMYGKKRMILFTVGLLVLGSVVCALSGSLPVLITGRALQGASSALIPLAIGMIRDSFPRTRVMMAIGVVSATMGVGGSLGMIVTGLIADRTPSHHPVFWITAVIGVVAMTLIALSTHESGNHVGGRPDFIGAVLLSAWLVCLLLALSKGNDWGWGSGRRPRAVRGRGGVLRGVGVQPAAAPGADGTAPACSSAATPCRRTWPPCCWASRCSAPSPWSPASSRRRRPPDTASADRSSTSASTPCPAR